MRKLLFVLPAMLLMVSCGVSNSLYFWGGDSFGTTTAYEKLAYKTYDDQTPKSICDLVAVYEKMVVNPGGQRQVPPPGVCAEYGYLLLQPGTAEIFSQNATSSQKRLFDGTDYVTIFSDRGKKMLEKEIELYPESAKFIMPLIRKLAE